MSRTLVPDLLLDAHGARSGWGVTIEDGRVVAVGPATEGERLPGRAIAPGFVNDHSHAFQRGLRGRVERRVAGHDQDDFWTWRTAMYALANDLDPPSMRRAAERCYGEMLAAGYTRVTEFHYVHHQPDGTPYDRPDAMAVAVAEAAASVGICLTLLPTAYARGGVARFRDHTVDAFLARVDALRAWAIDRPALRVGVAAHSVRAVPESWLRSIAEYARVHNLPLHIHANEQPREIEQSLAEYGCRPIELLARCDFLGPNVTVIHATHADEAELDLLRRHRCTVCVCPTTEGNLGDGFLPAAGIMRRGIRLSIGSDQHVRIDPLEELRELETNARRLTGKRSVLVAAGDSSPTPYLLQMGWQCEGLRPGGPADLIEIELTCPTLCDVEPNDLTDALVAGAGREVIAGAWVHGVRVSGVGG